MGIIKKTVKKTPQSFYINQEKEKRKLRGKIRKKIMILSLDELKDFVRLLNRKEVE